MNTFLLLAGAFAFCLAAFDIVKTTLSSNGGGPVTNAVSVAVWRLFFLVSGKKARSSMLDHTGMALLVAVLASWIALLWLGVFLMFASDPGSIVSSSTNRPASALEKLYYAGFSVSTLGVGDYKATADIWRILTTVSSFSGLVLLTTSVTYFVPVLSAVNLQSRLSLYVNSIGHTPQEMLRNSWNGKDFYAFAESTMTAANMLMQHTLHHHSYPILHYFHNTKPSLSVKRSIVQLAEASFFLQHFIDESIEKDHLSLTVLNSALDTYLETVSSGYVDNDKESETPLPDLQLFAEQGIPVIEPKTLPKSSLDALQKKRQLLTALLKSDGWSWQDVYQGGAKGIP